MEYASEENIWNYQSREIAAIFNEMLKKDDFYLEEYWESIELSNEINNLIENRSKRELSKIEIYKLNSLLFISAFNKYTADFENWGYGNSTKMIQELKESGIDKARLNILADEWDLNDYLPQVAIKAKDYGFLAGPYDSYYTAHNPKYYNTDFSWGTAQFDLEVYENGAIISNNGNAITGYGGSSNPDKGFFLNPSFIEPWMKKRVSKRFLDNPYNYYFLDGEATGDYTDDYSPDHSMITHQITR